jgi:serine/threonine protein phosphatase PrpC
MASNAFESPEYSEKEISTGRETVYGTSTAPLEKERPLPQERKERQSVPLPPIAVVSTCEEMNPTRRYTFEDCAVYAPAGTWNVPDPNMAFLCICDGHGGRQMVEYLEDGLIFHVAAELNATDDPVINEHNMDNGDATVLQRLERAFLMADIHSKTLGISTSGATVAVCLITRSPATTTLASLPSDEMADSHIDGAGMAFDTWRIYAANAGDARIVLGHAGKGYRLTKDHRTDDPDEVRRIEQSGGFLFKGRVLGVLAVTRSLGDHW